MKKLFLTSFTFRTGELEIREQRLVVASNLDFAYILAKQNFPKEYPQSELLSVIVHPAIELDVDHTGPVPEDEKRNILIDPANHHLKDLFQELKRGRPAQDQHYLQDCIDNLGGFPRV